MVSCQHFALVHLHSSRPKQGRGCSSFSELLVESNRFDLGTYGCSNHSHSGRFDLFGGQKVCPDRVLGVGTRPPPDPPMYVGLSPPHTPPFPVGLPASLLLVYLMVITIK